MNNEGSAASKAPLIRLRLDIAYDGTDFHGWATQPGLRSVQERLETAISVILREPKERVSLAVGGRTDAGVHARGQVAHIDVSDEQLAKWTGTSRGDAAGIAAGPESEVEAEGAAEAGVEAEAEASRRRARRLNGVLRREDPDIAVHSIRVVPGVFDARFSALRRRYEYRLRGEGSRRDPLTSRFTAEIPRELDLEAMQRASDELLGLNDFTTFCKAREGSTAVRDLLCFEWRETEDGAYAARIEADAFCHSMVRALVGAVVAVGHGRIGERELVELRDARERSSRFTVMPAHGLSLEEIAYPADAELEARAEQTRARRDPLA